MNLETIIVNFITSLLGIEYAKTIIDISKWQSTADDSRLFNFDVYLTSDGIMIIVKASQGIWIDRRFAYYIAEILTRNIFFGTYHFADMRQGPKSSAQTWAAQINALKTHGVGYKPPQEITRHWLDVEYYGFSGFSKRAGRAWVREFLAEMERLTDVKIGIYTSYYAWKDSIEPMPEIHERDLWLAFYGDESDLDKYTPEDWKNYGKTWLLWQKCDNCTECGGCGKVYGAASISIDIDLFNGTMKQFSEWRDTQGDEEMSSQEYEELKGDIAQLTVMIEDLAETFANHSHDGTEPPDPPADIYVIPMYVTADPNLRLRETPETGTIIAGMPYGSDVMGSDMLVPDSQGRMWRKVEYIVAQPGGKVYEGWTADWYLKKK